MIEFREHDSYINSDYDSDSDVGSAFGAHTPIALTNSLLEQARALVDAARQFPRQQGFPSPRIRYVLTRLEEHPDDGHPDPRIPETFAALREMGIELEFASQWGPPPRRHKPVYDAVPAQDVVLDLSVLIALCCDSTHYPLPRDEAELEARFRLLHVASDRDAAVYGGVKALAPHSGATRDLRDQLRCEMVRPLILEMRDRFSAAGGGPRFWCTREVFDRLPGLVEVIGGAAERGRAKALFDPKFGNFWEGSRWQGKAGCLTDIVVRVIEDEGENLLKVHEAQTPFDAAVMSVCERMISASGGTTPPSREPTPGPTKPVRPNKKKEAGGEANGKENGNRNCKEKRPMKTAKTVKSKTPKPDKEKLHPSRNPLRQGTNFPASSRLPSGHTLRTLLVGLNRRATVLTNNRGAVLKVMREAGVTDGIPNVADDGMRGHGARRARIWVVNPSSLAEWRRIEVEDSNRRIVVGANDGEKQERAVEGA